MTAPPSLEQQLLEYRAILDHAGIAVIFTRGQRVERCNQRAEALFGWPPGTLVGQSGRVFYRDDDTYQSLGRLAGPILGAGETFEVDIEFARRDGTPFLGHVIARPIDPLSSDAGTIWIASDVTLEREAARAKQRLLREQQLIFERVDAGIMFARDRRIERCNARFFEIFGYTQNELLGQSTRILGLDDASWTELGVRGYGAVAATGSFTSEEPFQHRDGHTIWCRLSGSMLDPADPGQGYVWVYEDVTARKHAVEEAQRIQYEQQQIFDRAEIGIAYVRDRKVQRCNRRFEEMIGFAPGEAIGKSTREYFHSDEEWKNTGKVIYQSIQDTGVYHGEWPLLRRDGQSMWCRFSGSLLDPAHPERGYVWLHEDVTARRAAERALADAHRQQELVFNNAMIGISYQKNRIIERCNHRLEEIFGYPPGDLQGKSTRVLYLNDEDWADAGQRVFEQPAGKTTYDAVMRFAHCNGSPLWVHVIGRAVEVADGGDTWIWTYEDVSTQQAAEIALKDAMHEYDMIFDNTLIGVSYLRNRVVVRCNHRFEAIFGFRSGELVGKNLRVLYDSEEEYKETARRVRDHTDPVHGFSGDIRYRHRDGRKIWVQVHGRPVQKGNEEVWIWTHQDVTRAHEAEEALRHSHAELEKRVLERTAQMTEQLNFLNQLIEAIPGPVFYKDQNGRYLGCNRAYAEFVGVSAENLVGKTAHDIAPIELADKYKALDDALFAHPGAQVYESQVQIQDGSRRNVLFHKATFMRADGDVGGIVGVILDITERKRMEERLQQAATVFDAAVEGIVVANADGAILAVNPAFTRITGYSEAEAIGQNPRMLQSGRHDKAFYRAMWHTIQTDGRWSGEVWNRKKDGNIYPEWLTLSAVRDASGSVKQYIAVFSDIQATKEAESEQRIAATAFDAHQSMFVTDSDGIILRVNQAFVNETGYATTEAIGQTPALLKSGRHDVAFYERMWAEIGSTGNWIGEIWDRRKNGQIFPAWLTISAVTGPQGEVTHYVAHLVDITSRKQAEEALEENREKYRALSEAAFEAIFISEKGRCLEVNKRAELMFGYSAEESVGKFGTDWIIPEDRERVMSYMISGYELPYEATALRKDGSTFPAMIRARMASYKGKNVRVTSLNDITDRKQAEAARALAKQEVDALNASLEARVATAVQELETSHRSLLAAHQQLTQTETMASLGRMVAVIAHELNTPIGNSRLAASTMRENAHEFQQKSATGVRRSDLEKLINSIDTGTHILDSGLQRAAHLISSFKQIAVDQTSAQRRRFSIEGLVDEIATTLEPSVRRSGCKLNWEIRGDIELDSYPGPLSHVLINLIDNAMRHAFIDRGPGTIAVYLEGNSDQGLDLRVSDNGNGIKGEHQKHIFEPFFTTQMGRGGTGLGLSIVYNIVTGVLGGRISVASELGMGTCFEVALPLIAPVSSVPPISPH